MTSRSNADEGRTLPARVVVGRVRKAHGLAGELAIEIDSDVADRFAPGSFLWAVRSAAGSRPERVCLASCRAIRGGALIGFEGYDDRDAADTLRGAVLEVDRDQVPPAGDDAWYWFELMGCRCFDRQRGALGTVVDVIEDGGGLLLDLADAADRRLLVPFVRAFLVSVDVKAGRIDLRLPDGLVETCTSTP